MEFKEEDIQIIDEDIQGGYSRVHLLYSINNCLMIDLYVKDWERGVEVLKVVSDKLKDVDLSEDVEYDKNYDKEVEAHLKWKKEHEKEKKRRIVA